MRTLSAAARAEIVKQRNSPFVWLYEMTLEYTTSTWRKLYATSHDAQVTWAGNDYKPFPVTHQRISADSAGGLPTIEVQASNVTREIAAYAWDTRGFSGLPFAMHVLHKATLGSGDSILSLQLTATSCTIDSLLITARLGAPPWLEYEVPADTYGRNQCQHVYKEEATCRYRGTLPTCDLSLFGANGCVVHGDDEVANGLPRMHPRLYGGFPAIPSIPV